MIASEYGVGPDWELMEQLDVCRPNQETKEGPVSAQSPGELSVEVPETQVVMRETAGAAAFSHMSDEDW
eukprot:8809852-Prorocentrum_lima.AAC.1